MSKAVPSVGNPEKWACSACDYGHDVGKSRNAVYKHFKKHHQNDSVKETKTTNSSLNFSGSQSSVSENENLHKIEDSTEKDDFVKSESISTESSDDKWGSIEWDENDVSETDVKPKGIPNVVKNLGQGGFDPRTQGHLVRLGFRALDRAVTHYGRGVMSDPSYKIERSEEDYDALEQSTVQMMMHYGVSVPVNPLMLWSVTVGTAYAPPLMHIRKNADPNRPKKGILRAILGRFRRKRSRPTTDPQRTPTEQRN